MDQKVVSVTMWLPSNDSVVNSYSMNSHNECPLLYIADTESNTIVTVPYLILL